MISLIYGLILSMLCYYWGSYVISFLLISLFSLSMFNLNFSYSLSTIFQISNLSGVLIFLSSLLLVLSLISTPFEKSHKYVATMISLMLMLFMAFSVMNVIHFYIFFEASLIPTLFLIISWGYQPERLQAGSYMMLYTVCASLPLLLFIVMKMNDASSNNMWLLMQEMGSYKMSYMSMFFCWFAFLVKLPMYSTHLWLPKAHVEAPLAGSMILAGILLKLGGYGLFLMLMMFNDHSMKYIIFSLAIWGGLLSTFMCLQQSDMKSYVAYSSVNHMSLVIVGVLSNSIYGSISAIITMFAHGITSSALFCLTYFTYEKTGSRSMYYSKGLLKIYPYLSLFWFLFLCLNMAAPPSMNLVGELFLVPCLYKLQLMYIFLMGCMVFMSGAYNMYLYSNLNHGSFLNYCLPSSPMKSYNFLSLFMHLFPFMFLLKMNYFVFSETRKKNKLVLKTIIDLQNQGFKLS